MSKRQRCRAGNADAPGSRRRRAAKNHRGAHRRGRIQSSTGEHAHRIGDADGAAGQFGQRDDRALRHCRVTARAIQLRRQSCGHIVEARAHRQMRVIGPIQPHRPGFPVRHRSRDRQ